jgi:hypothetical protein
MPAKKLLTDPHVVAVAENYSTQNGTSTPVQVRHLGPMSIEVQRAGVTGTAAVYGVKLPGLYPQPKASDQTKYGTLLKGTDDLQSSTGRSYFYAAIPYTAISGYNWICIVRDASAGTETVYAKDTSATTSAGTFFIETYDSGPDGAGAMVKLTLGGSAAGGDIAAEDEIELYYVGSADTLVSCTADFAGQHVKEETASGYDMMWLVLSDTSSVSATTVYARRLIV